MALKDGLKGNGWLSLPGKPADDATLDPASAAGQLSPARSSSPSPISLPDKTERVGYYFGLVSQPPLLARSSTTVWALPLGPFNRPRPKQLKNVGNHKVAGKWDDGMAAEVLKILETHSVQWTSVELFRIGEVGQKNMPVILWIGVRPGTLTDGDGTSLPAAGKVAVACKQVLENHNILDVECEIKESETYRGATPALVTPSMFQTPAVDVEVFFSPTIGTCISPKNQTAEGTFGFYVTFPDHPGKVYGVTSRHVLFPDIGRENKTYHHRNPSQPRRSVVLPGDGFLKNLRESALKGAKDQKLNAAIYQKELGALAEEEGWDADRAKLEAQIAIQISQLITADFDSLVRDIDTKWKTPESRVVGYVVYSPPIGTGDRPDNYTRDWCLYEVDPSKIKDFSGNVIDLGCELTVPKVDEAMNPNIKNPHKFSYPLHRQWQIQSTCIPRDEMRNPKTYSRDNSPALSVLKRGRTTGVTCGVANEIDSFTRTYSGAISFESREWAIVGYDKSTAFSDHGDSGSLVVDAQGRMGGMLTGGSGFEEKIDVTYVTPMEFLLADMEKCGWRKPKTNVAPQAGGVDSRQN